MTRPAHLIGSRWRVDGEDETPTVVRDPATGEVVAEVPVAGAAYVDAAVAAAAEAAPSWARTPAAERAAALVRVADRLSRSASELARSTTAEMGRPASLAEGGVGAGAAAVRQYAELGPLHRGRSLLGQWDAIDLMVPEPRGVVGVVTPWNDPVAVPAQLLAAALVVGNTVVLKPSERAPVTGQLVAEAFAAELPPGVLGLVHGGATTGRLVAGHPGVHVVVHVGSTAAGRWIAEATARTGARAVLENGGNDAMVVDGDVDAEWAAGQAALGGFINSGQLCTAVERVYVHESLAEEFLAALVKEAEALVMGPGDDPATTLGPLVDVRARESVHAQVSDAQRRGATTLTGGFLPDGPGAFYPPTVLRDVDPAATVLGEETFGPVLPVVTVPDFAAGLAAAGASSYGLAATVLTHSQENAQRAWRELDVGTVKVNAVFGGAPGGAAQPRRSSGDGFGYGPELLDELTTTKVVHLSPARPRSRS